MCGLIVLKGEVPELKAQNIINENSLFHRGPDSKEIFKNTQAFFVFYRLAIMDLSAKGNQPFEDEQFVSVCNGEIYNFLELKKQFDYEYKSTSDCEVLIPMFKKLGASFVNVLDAEFACIILDKEDGSLFAARDPIGIRPLFYGYQENGEIAFASEVKALMSSCKKIIPFPPGHYYYQEKFVSYRNVTQVKQHNDLDYKIYKNIAEKLIKGVEKRMSSDAPMGFLLSGGLDSSLVCAIAARMSDKPIVTFSTGMTTDPIDTKYAKIVADHIGSIHHEVLFTKEDVLNSLNKVIQNLETWDITTIRASIGMYLVCKYIKEKTNVKVLMTGEISDELFGYKYTDFAPSPEEFQKESEKRMTELYYYDVLRADRCIAANSLEARVPFGDLDFVEYVMSINPEKKMKHPDLMGKFLLRKSFEIRDYDEKGNLLGKELLPYEILWREKAAFSDAVGHSMVDHLKDLAEEKITDEELASAKELFPHGTPFTKESMLYRIIFEQHYPGKSNLIPDFWMPNKNWEGCQVSDPSARVLKNYGKSGQ